MFKELDLSRANRNWRQILKRKKRENSREISPVSVFNWNCRWIFQIFKKDDFVIIMMFIVIVIIMIIVIVMISKTCGKVENIRQRVETMTKIQETTATT